MTPRELEILKVISCKDVETFLPADRTAAQVRAFDELVEVLQGMRRLGWIQIEVAKHRGRQSGRYQPQYLAAVARCTDEGRRALQMLGEG